MSDFASDEDFMAVMLGEFLDESEGQLSRLNENLLVLDELVGALEDADAAEADHELLNEMFRDAHSLKGLSAMLGFEDINKLTHRIENVFDAARRDNLGITRQLTDLMFQAIDHLTTMVDNLKQSEGSKSEVHYEAVVDRLQQLIGGNDEASGTEHAPTEEAGPPESATSTPSREQAGPPSPAASPSPIDSPDPTVPASAPPTNAANSAPEGRSDQPQIDESLDDVQDEPNIPEKYLSIFIDESDQALDELCELLERYGEVRADALSTISHRIKGAAASIGLNRIAKLAHAMEDVLQDCRERGGEISEQAADALFFATDALRTSLDPLRNGHRVEDNFAAAHRMLCQVHRCSADSATTDSRPDQSDESAATGVPGEEVASLARIAQGVPRDVIDASGPDATVLVGMIHLRPGLPMADVKVKMILDRLAALGEIIHRSPSDDDPLDGDHLERIEFGLVTPHPVDLIRSQVDLDGVERIDMQSLKPLKPLESPADAQVTPSVTNPSGAQPRGNASPQSAWDQFNSDFIARPVAKADAPDQQVKPAAAATATPPVSATPPGSANVPAGPTPSNESKDAAPAARTAPASPTGEKSASSQQGAAKERPAETLRVDIERLDQLMNLSGQLVINKAQFSQLSEQLKGVSTRKQSVYKLSNATAMLERMLTETNAASGVPSDAGFSQQMRNHIMQVKEDLAVVERDLSELCQTRNTVNSLCEAVHQLDRITDGIQKCVMDTRMVPVGPLFSRFKRVVRDVTRLNGKDIALEIHGEKTELDKRMIDAIADPLIHMVRNSADHGVESPEDRRALGKPARGTISLVAFHRGNRVFIQVRDDGKGLDPVKLREKAIAKGIISAQEAERLSDQQCLQLIWEPGFSTAEKITEVSGRGMGMDIVRSKIEQLSGTVELDSEVGVGTTITIKLPLTMAILPSLLTVVANDVFAIPLESVKEIVRVKNKDISTVRGINTATVRGRVISLVELAELFHWNTPVSRATLDDQEHTLVIVGADGDELGLAVDRLLGEEDIVIKSLAENYRNVEGLAGASILGDGRVSLILDVGSLLSQSYRHNAAVETETAS